MTPDFQMLVSSNRNKAREALALVARNDELRRIQAKLE
jgi:hypothetical protein